MAAELGWVGLGVSPDFTGFKGQVDRETSKVMGAAGVHGGEEFGTSAGKSAGSKFKSAIKSAAKVAAVGLAAAGAVAFKFGADSLEEAREAQKVGALTTNTIKATGGAAKVTAQHVADLSGAISEKVGIDDEVIQRGANMLLTFKNIRNEVGKGSKVFDRTTQAVTDMAAGMAGGGGGDIDLKSSSILMGKALNDPVKGLTALTRVGITFTEQQKAINTALVEGGDIAALNALGFKVTTADFKKAQEDRKLSAEETVKFFTGPMSDAEQQYFDHLAEGGHTLEAQKNILKEVNSQFGGAAEAQATDAEKMKVAWGNFKEEVGTELLPVMDDLATFLTNKGIPKAREFFGWIKDTGVPAIKDWADDLKPVVGFTKDLVGYLNDLPKEVKIGGLGALAAVFLGAKFRGGKSGLLGTAGSALGMTKPIPVFVTNAGAGALGAGVAGSGSGKTAAVAGTAAKTGSRMTIARGAIAITAAYFAADAITKILDWKEETPKQKKRREDVEHAHGDKPIFDLIEDARVGLSKQLGVSLGKGPFGLLANDEGLSDALAKQDPTRLIALNKQLHQEYGVGIRALERQGVLVDGTFAAYTNITREARETSKVFGTFPKDLKTEVMLNGVDRSLADVRGLVKQYDLTKTQRSTLFEVLGVDRNKQTMKTYTGILRDAGKPVKTPVSLLGVGRARAQIDDLVDGLNTLASFDPTGITGLAAVGAAAAGRGRNGGRPRNAGRDRDRQRALGGGP